MAEVAPQFALRALLLAAIVPESLATEYVQYTSGATCEANGAGSIICLLYTSPSPRDS